MARTIYGNYTGHAAVTERREQFNSRIESILQEQRQDRLFEDRYWQEVEQLKAIDPGFEAWFWSRPEQTKGDMLPLIEARILDIEERREVYEQQTLYIMGMGG